MQKEKTSVIEFRRARTAKEKQSIAQGMRDFWKTQPKGAKGDVKQEQKSNKKLAIGVVSGLATVGALGYAAKKGKLKTRIANKKNQLIQQLDNKIEQEAFKGAFGKVAGLPPEKKNAIGRFIDARIDAGVRGAKRGVQEGAKQRVATEGSKFVANVENKAQQTKDYVLNTPQRTAQAFREGYKNPGSYDSAPRRLGRWIAKRGKEDIATAKRIIKADTEMRKRILGFNNGSAREEFWIEFQAKKAKPQRPAKKQLSAEHRAAISRGLQEYYDSIPQKQETKADKAEKVSRSVMRIARAGKTAAEAGTLGYGLYKAITAKPVKKTFLDNVMGGVDAVNSVSGSLSNLGRGVSSITNAANAIHDITSGSKKRQLALKEEAIKIKREANKTNRQVHSVRAKLERRRAKQRDEQMLLDAVTGEAYKNLVNVTASTKPSEVRAALQRAATGAKKQEIKKGDDEWFL